MSVLSRTEREEALEEIRIIRENMRRERGGAISGPGPGSTFETVGSEAPSLKESSANIRAMVDRIYTLEEAAEVLKIKPRTLRQWVTDGKIKSFKIGDRGLIRIHEEDLQAFIDQERRRSRKS